MDQAGPEPSLTNGGPRGVSRRRLIGRTAAVGAALTAGAVIPAVACSDANDEGSVARGAGRAPAFEFVGQIRQNGADFQGLGFITVAAGLDVKWLFADPAEVAEHSERSARLTVYGEVALQSRSVRGKVFVLDGVGELAVHFNETPGADFARPETFRAGPVVARYSMRLRDVLTVIAPNEGIPVLTGELTQLEAAPFEADVGRRVFGAKGTRLALDGTGHGVRSQADPPIATIDLAAQLTVV